MLPAWALVAGGYDCHICAARKNLLCLFAIPSPLQHIATGSKMVWDVQLINNLKRRPERPSDLTGTAAGAIPRWVVQVKQILLCRSTPAGLRLSAYWLK